jgi:hypothetical protein
MLMNRLMLRNVCFGSGQSMPLLGRHLVLNHEMFLGNSYPQLRFTCSDKNYYKVSERRLSPSVESTDKRNFILIFKHIRSLPLQLPIRIINQDQYPRPSTIKLQSSRRTYTVSSLMNNSFRLSFISL